MKKMVIAGLLAAAASGAMADGAFDGVNAQLGMGFANLGTQYTDNYTDVNPSDSSNYTVKGGQNGMLGNVALGYSYGFNKQFNIAANVFYNFGSDNAGSIGGTDGSGSYNTQAKLKNIWGISVEPGYYFSDKSLGFVKLGWAMASTSANWSGNSENGTLNVGTANGFLYGLGFKHLLTENVYVGLDAYQVTFSSKSTSNSDEYGTWTGTFKPNMTYGGINVGYKF
jgi:hypothetical protein